MAKAAADSTQRQIVEDFERIIADGDFPDQLELNRAADFISRIVETEPGDRPPADSGWAELLPVVRDGLYRETSLDDSDLSKFRKYAETANRSGDQIPVAYHRNQRIVFLVGAGASVPSGIPGVSDLLPELWKKASKTGRRSLSRLERWCKNRGITNIEDLLTAAYVANSAATNKPLASLLRYFLAESRPRSEEETERDRHRAYLIRHRLSTEQQRPQEPMDPASIAMTQDTLQTLFGLLTSTMLAASPNPIHNSIAAFASRTVSCSIITTNYDVCMDEALRKRGVRLVEAESLNGDTIPTNGTPFLKMHGSIDWTYCDSCNQMSELDLATFREQFSKHGDYPILGSCNCSGMRRPLIVPPLALKFISFPHLIEIWSAAKRLIDAADIIVIIGYSMSDADAYITQIISRSMFENKHQRLIVFNRGPRVTIRLRDKYRRQIEKFDDSRILSSVGNAEKVLPGVVTKWSRARS